MAIEDLDYAIKELYLTGRFSDLEVRCGDLVAKVHKNVVCTQSDWFSNAIVDDRFLEGTSGVIEIKDQNPTAVKTMLEYLYTGVYRCPDNLVGGDGELMLFHLDVYAVADLIQHKKLKDMVEARFKAVVKRSYTDSLFPSVIRKTYEVSPPGSHGAVLRSIVVDTTAKHVSEICDAHADFEETVEQVPAFGARLALTISRLHREPLWTHGRALKCITCNETVYVSSDHAFSEECPHNRHHRGRFDYDLRAATGDIFPQTYQCSGPERHRCATRKEPEICYACNASVKLLKY